MAERILEADYPMYYGYLYIVNDKVYQHTGASTTVGEWTQFRKSCGEDVVVKNCDVKARNLFHLMV